MDVVKALEELLAKGYVEEVYEDGELKYRLTEKGERWILGQVKDNASLWLWYCMFSARQCGTWRKAYAHLLLSTLMVFYGLEAQEARQLVDAFFKSLEEVV